MTALPPTPAALAEEEAAARALGYTHHPPPKLWLDHLDYLRTPGPGKAHLTPTWDPRTTWATGFTAGSWPEPLPPRPPSRTLASRGDAEHRLRQCPWAAGRVWLVVRDGNGPYVILSLRNPRKVAEVALLISWGPGSYDRSDSTPAQAMGSGEIQEELGLLPLPWKHLTLLSLGWITERTSSSSYLWETDYTFSCQPVPLGNRLPPPGSRPSSCPPGAVGASLPPPGRI